MSVKEIRVGKYLKKGFFHGKNPQNEDINTLNVLEGEKIVGEIFKYNKKKYKDNISPLFCRKIFQIKKESPKRIKSKCDFFLDCGGCSFQHIDYEYELKLKKNRIQKIFKKKPEKFFNSNKKYFYRNRLEFDIENQKAGMHPRLSKYITDINNCHIMDKKLNIFIKNKLQEKKKDFEGEVRAVTYDEGVISRWYPKYQSKETSINDLKYGKKTIKGIPYYISPDVFFQANDEMIPKWLDTIKSLLLESKNNINSIIDLYSGIGMISLYLHEYVDKIKAVEVNDLALFLAKKSAKEMNIEHKIDFYNKDLRKMKIQNIDAESIIVNPPRGGMSEKVRDFICTNNFKSIIYSSCNPETFNRDINLIKKKYKLKKYFVFDFFPRTCHMEVLGKLKRKD